jgi:predicted RNase H-like HicB family nuclease
MTVYRVPVIVRAPCEETEDKYLAEVPVLPGCRAWGDTPAEALSFVQGVAAAFIESYRDREDPLPDGLSALAGDARPTVAEGEMLVSA